MAKWGEGDPRWIVEERPDATNVNNWHWYGKMIFIDLHEFENRLPRSIIFNQIAPNTI